MLRATEPFRRLLAGIDLTNRVVLEIGVGTGVITRMVLDRGPLLVLGYEIDPDICKLRDARLDLRVADFQEATLPPPGTCLIAAPPYGLLDALRPLVSGPDPLFDDVVLMVPEKRRADFPEFVVAFALNPDDFDPPTNPGRHLVLRRGFLGAAPT